MSDRQVVATDSSITVTGGTQEIQVDHAFIISQLTEGTHYDLLGTRHILYYRNLIINADYYNDSGYTLTFDNGLKYTFTGRYWNSGSEYNQNGVTMNFSGIDGQLRIIDPASSQASPAAINLYASNFNIQSAVTTTSSILEVFFDSAQYADVNLSNCFLKHFGTNSNTGVFFRLRRATINTNYHSDLTLINTTLRGREGYRITHSDLKFYGGNRTNGSVFTNIDLINADNSNIAHSLEDCEFNMPSNGFARLHTGGINTTPLVHTIVNPIISSLERFQTNYGNSVRINIDLDLRVTDLDGNDISNARISVKSGNYIFNLPNRQTNTGGNVSFRLVDVYHITGSSDSSFGSTPQTASIDRRDLEITIRRYGFYDQVINTRANGDGKLTIYSTLKRDELIEQYVLAPFSAVSVANDGDVTLNGTTQGMLRVYESYKYEIYDYDRLDLVDAMYKQDNEFFLDASFTLVDNISLNSDTESLTLTGSNSFTYGTNSRLNMRYAYSNTTTMFLIAHYDYVTTRAENGIKYITAVFNGSNGDRLSVSTAQNFSNFALIEYLNATDIAVYCMHPTSKISIARDYRDLDYYHLNIRTIENLRGETDVQSVHDALDANMSYDYSNAQHHLTISGSGTLTTAEVVKYLQIQILDNLSDFVPTTRDDGIIDIHPLDYFGNDFFYENLRVTFNDSAVVDSPLDTWHVAAVDGTNLASQNVKFPLTIVDLSISIVDSRAANSATILLNNFKLKILNLDADTVFQDFTTITNRTFTATITPGVNYRLVAYIDGYSPTILNFTGRANGNDIILSLDRELLATTPLSTNATDFTDLSSITTLAVTTENSITSVSLTLNPTDNLVADSAKVYAWLYSYKGTDAYLNFMLNNATGDIIDFRLDGIYIAYDAFTIEIDDSSSNSLEMQSHFAYTSGTATTTMFPRNSNTTNPARIVYDRNPHSLPLDHLTVIIRDAFASTNNLDKLGIIEILFSN